MNEIIKTVQIDADEVEVVGYYESDTPEGEWDFFDLFWEGECINFGEALHEEPTVEVARRFLTNYKRSLICEKD